MHHPEVLPDLRGSELLRWTLQEANLRRTNISQAILNGSSLSKADLREAKLSEVDVREASLKWAVLTSARPRGVDQGRPLSAQICHRYPEWDTAID